MRGILRLQMKYRGKLGTQRALIDARFDVNVEAIPFLEPGYQLIGVDQLAIGGDAPKDFIVFPCSERYGRAYIAKAPSRALAFPPCEA